MYYIDMENQTYNKDIISESEAITIPHSNPMRDRIFQVLEQNIELDEDSISKLYKEADNDKITLLCSYCTKIE